MVNAKQRFRLTPLNGSALLLGCTSFAAVVYLSQEWGVYNGLTGAWPWVFALTFVGFTTLIFEIGVGLLVFREEFKAEPVERNGAFFIRKPTEFELKQMAGRRASRVVGAVFAILLAMTLETYTVVSSMGAMYNLLVNSKQTQTTIKPLPTAEGVGTKKVIWTEKQTENKRSAKVLDDAYTSAIALYNKTVRVEFKDLKPTELSALPVTLEFNRTKLTYEMKKSELKAEKDSIDAALLALADDGDVATNAPKTSAAVNHGTVYTYMRTLTGIDELYLQFWLTAWPSFFLGLINALSFAYVLYGKRK